MTLGEWEARLILIEANNSQFYVIQAKREEKSYTSEYDSRHAIKEHG